MANINGRRRYWQEPTFERMLQAVVKEFKKKHKNRDPDNEEISFLRVAARKKRQAAYAAIEREGGNMAIQSVNADMTKDAMAGMRLEFKHRGYKTRMYNSVYDEIVIGTEERSKDDVHELQQKIMIKSGEKFIKKVPVEVEGHLLKYWTK